jgi:hypothetical protein
MKAQGKMEEDKLEITMEDSDLMQQDHRVTLLEEDQVDHSMLGDPQETPMEGGLVQDLEMVIMEADPLPMLLEEEDLLIAVLADLRPPLDFLGPRLAVLTRRAGEGSSSGRE